MNLHHALESRVRALCLLLLPAIVGTSGAQSPPPFDGHLSGVSSAVFSPDGSLLVTGSFDRTVKIWDAAGGEALRTLTAHQQQVLCVAMHPAGRQIATGSRDSVIHLWDLYIPTPLQTFAGHTAAINAVIVAPDGSWTATAGADKSVRLWDGEGKLLRQFSAAAAGQPPLAHQHPVSRMAVNKDGTQLASGDEQGWVRLWNPADGALLGTLGADSGKITGMGFHPDGSFMTASANGSVKWWKLPVTAPVVLPPHLTAVTSVAATVDGGFVLTGSADGSVQWFNGADGKLVRTLTAATAPKLGEVHATTLHMATGLAAAAGAEGIVQFWSIADGADKLRLAGHTGAIHDLDVNAKGDQWATAGADGSVRIWRTPAPALALPGHTMAVRAVAGSRDGKLLVTASADKKIRLFNAVDSSLARAIDTTATVTAIDLRPDAVQLVSGNDQGHVELWNSADGASQGRFIGHVGEVTGVVCAPDGKTVMSSGSDGTLRWWNATALPPKSLAAAATPVQRVATTANGAETLVGSDDGVIRVFTTATGALARPLTGHTGPVTALDTQGAQAASGSEDGIIRQWTLATAAPLPPIAAHDGPVLDLAISPAANQIASVGVDGLVRLWRSPVAPKTMAGSAMTVTTSSFSADGSMVASSGVVGGKPTVVVRDQTGAVKATIAGHTAAVTSLAFSADKTKLISGSADKTAKVWNLAAVKEPLAEYTLPAAVTAVAFSANAAEAIAGAANGALAQFKTADGAEVRALAGHTGAISALIVRGATLISGSADKTVRQWNLASGAALRSMNHGAAVTSVSASANGLVLASAGADKLIKLWNGANGAALKTLEGHIDAPHQVVLNPEGTQVLGVAPKQIRHWDATGELRERYPLTGPQRAAFAPTNLIAVMDTKHALHVLTPSLTQWIAAHEGRATAVDFTTAGTSLVTAGADKSAKLWSAADGKLLSVFGGSTGALADVAVSADGKWLAAGGEDKIVRVWSVPAQPAAQPATPAQQWNVESPISTLAFSADNQRLAVGLQVAAGAGAGQTLALAIWDLSTSRPLQWLGGHSGAVTSLAFLPDNVTLVSGSADKSTVIQTLSALRVVNVSDENVNDLSLANDGTVLATAAGKQLTLWNAADGAVRTQVPLGAVTGESVSLRGDLAQLAAVGSDGQLYLWPLTAQGVGPVVKTAIGPSPKAPAPPQTTAVARVRYDSQGDRLVVSGADTPLRIFDTTGVLLEQIEASELANDVHFTASAETLLVARGDAAQVQPLSMVSRLAGHEGAVTAVRFLPDGASLISGGADKSLRLWSVADGKPTRQFSGADVVTAAVITADGKQLIASSADKMVRIWDLTAVTPTVAPAAVLEHPAVVQQMSLSTAEDGGMRLATAGDDGIARVWDLTSRRELERFADHEGPVRAIALTANNKLLTGGDDKTARVATLAATRLFVGGETAVNDAVVFPDGSAVATIDDAMQVKLWDVAGKPLRQLAGAKAPLQTLAVRGDNLQVAAADAEGRVLLWNAADGVLQQTIETGAAVHALAFSVDHQRIAAAGAGEGPAGRLQVYRTDDAQLVQQQQAPGPLLAVRFANGGRELFTGSADQRVDQWACASPEPIAALTGHVGAVLSLEYSRDGAGLVSAGADGAMRTWNLETKTVVRAFTGHTGAVYAARYTPDGKLLVSCGADGSSRLWNVANGAVVRQAVGETLEPPQTAPPLFDVAISPNAQQAAVSGQDGIIRIWNLSNGQQAKQIPITSPAYRMEYRSDGLLMAASLTGELTLWNAAGTKTHAAKAPTVVYGAALHPTTNKQVALPSADGKTYVLALP